MPETTRGRILVVDDEADIRDLLYDFLTGQGYAVRIATSGEEALVKIRQETPETILLDVRMPDMSGLDVLRAIRAAGNPVYVIMVTALNDEATHQQALQLGADAFVTKPFDLWILERHLGGPTA